MISSKTLWDRDNRNNGISGAIRLGDKTKKGRSVGTYYSEWYGFEVASKRHLMDLLIEPSFDHAICVQFHEMQDGEYRAFYNYQPSWKEIVDAVKAYAYEQKMDPSTKANVVLDIAASAGVFKPLAPVYDYLLEEEGLRCVEKLYINELPDARQIYNNQNIMGRIEIPNMNINNYVTRTSDNSYYLNYNLYNIYDQIGAPFFDYRNTNLNTDKQINIYGHNTQNNKILDKLPFTNLEQYTNQDVFNNNKDIYLYIDERKVHYEVIAIKIITDDVEHMNIVFDDNKKFIEHAKKLLSNSLYIRDAEITKKDRLLVLQICHYDPMGSYLLVIGKEV